MGLRFTAAALLGFVFLAGVVLPALCDDRKQAAVTELDGLLPMTRKILEGNETKDEMEEEPKKLAYIEPCCPPHSYCGPAPLHWSECGNGTECRIFDSVRCGLKKECTDFIEINCTEHKVLHGLRGPVRHCVNTTSETVTKCREFKVCTTAACLPPKPAAPPMAPEMEDDTPETGDMAPAPEDVETPAPEMSSPPASATTASATASSSASATSGK